MIVAYKKTMYPLFTPEEELSLFTSEKSKNNWNIGPFLRWWDKQEEEGKCQKHTKTQMAYIAWEAAIDYYIDKLKEETSLKETKNDL